MTVKENVVTCLSNSAQVLIVAKGFELLGEASLSFVGEDNKFDLTFGVLYVIEYNLFVSIWLLVLVI